MTEEIRVCLDPAEEVQQPTDVKTRMALMKGAMWGPTFDLRIRFLGGS